MPSPIFSSFWYRCMVSSLFSLLPSRPLPPSLSLHHHQRRISRKRPRSPPQFLLKLDLGCGILIIKSNSPILRFKLYWSARCPLRPSAEMGKVGGGKECKRQLQSRPICSSMGQTTDTGSAEVHLRSTVQSTSMSVLLAVWERRRSGLLCLQHRRADVAV